MSTYEHMCEVPLSSAGSISQWRIPQRSTAPSDIIHNERVRHRYLNMPNLSVRRQVKKVSQLIMSVC
jgi:hypothetical protein